MKRQRSRPIYTSLFAILVAFGTAFGVIALSPLASTAGASQHSNIQKQTPTTSTFQICDVAGDSGQTGASYPVQVGTWNGSFYKEFFLSAEATPGQCGNTYSFPTGTQMLVEQGASPGVGINPLTAVPTFSASNGSPINGAVPTIDLVAVHLVNAGATVLTITDNTPKPNGWGTLELCKTAGDNFVTGSYNFTLTGPAGTPPSASVIAGQCDEITVPASSPITVTEAVSFPYAMTSASAIPPTALLSSDNDTQTAVVTVPPNSDSTLFITNSTLEGYAKICKTLDRSQDNVLAGQTFTFDVSATFNGAPISGVPSTVPVIAGDYGTTTCAFLSNSHGPILLPLGSVVTASEVVPSGASFQPVGTSISPSNLNDGSTTGTAVFYVGNYAGSGSGNLGAGSVTQATFTNEALGYVEVCKTSDGINPINPGTPFNFTIGGVAGTITVPVGLCSLGYQLPVGTTTITETATPHISTTWSDTEGETGTGDTATVTVPYNTENIVYFDNEINTGQLKICKIQTSSDAGLQNSTFDLSYSYTLNGTVVSNASSPDMLKPGQCAQPITVPVLNGNLTPVQISITEGTTTIPDVAVEPADGATSGITVVGPDTVVSQPTYPWPVSTPGGTPATIVVNSLEGITNVTFTNGIDIPPAG